MDYSKYNFNPFQFTGPDWWMRDFHSRHVSYFDGCKRILDLGAGRGFFLECLKDRAISGLGVESHIPSVEQGEANGLAFSRMDIFEFFRSVEGQNLSSTCDGVYCAHVLEHLDPEQVFELFKSVRRYCAPNVRCRFITNNPADISVLSHVFWGDLTHKRLYPGFVLEAMARSQGFSRTRSENFLGVKIGRKDSLRRIWDRLFWGPHKWLPNVLLDCKP
jgi:2-polyprenyl-3-methyl-5-hydroxy-6-metoxy-1,4-benzoquinol methylase